MARNKNNQLPPEPGPPTNGWVISFSDCMTNLLCFFVLLVSFSSFDTSAQSRIQGAFASMKSPAISDRKTEPTDAVAPSRQRPYDPTAEGAEKPTDEPPDPVRKTDHAPVPNVKAFQDHVTLSIPSGKLFWGAGDLLTPAGRKSLKLIGSYMRLLPVRAVVSQQGAPKGEAEDLGLKRAWAVVSCICDEARMTRDRFCITNGQAGKGLREPVVEILLLRKELIR